MVRRERTEKASDAVAGAAEPGEREPRPEGQRGGGLLKSSKGEEGSLEKGTEFLQKREWEGGNPRQSNRPGKGAETRSAHQTPCARGLCVAHVYFLNRG